MLIDLLNQENYAQYNVTLAHIIGLKPSIYLNEVISIQSKAYQKKKLIDGYIKLDKQYIQNRTTLTEAEQKEIETQLCDLGLISRVKRDNEWLVSVDISFLSHMLSDGDNTVKNVQKYMNLRSGTKVTKRQGVANNLKTFIVCNNDELREAYECWIDGVYANPKGFLSKLAIKTFIETVDNFANHNLDVALDIVKIATINGYRDANWAIDKYVKGWKTYKTTNDIADSVAVAEDEVF